MNILHYSSRALAIVVFIFCLELAASAQTDAGTIDGRITDPSGAVIVGTQMNLTSIDRGTVTHTLSNKAGIYVLPGVPPGRYNLSVSHSGFREVDLTNLVVNVQSNIEQNFRLSVGSVSESTTVNGEDTYINTTDASVGTVIDRQFVENIPMNGRSFQSLVLLSPGTVTNTPQIGSGTPPSNDQGEYSVNGMRNDANSFMVDGASASNAPSVASAAGSAGMLSSATILGTTQAMLPLDAMQEFRITTSTYSAEYGRQPGAQVSFRSRSGTKDYHGTAYDYFRNSAFDANNWFNTYSTTPIPTPAERQNDFGGTFGGPIWVPRLFPDKNRTFFFFAYEGLRLTQPLPASIYYVPSNGTYNTGAYFNALYKNLRTNAPAVLKPVLNGFPLPNCSTAQDSQCVDYGNGGSPYISSPNSKGAIDSINARIDFQLLPSMRIFARYQDTTSNAVSDSPGGPYTSNLVGRNRVYLFGVDDTFGASISNELRLQYSPALFKTVAVASSAGGAVPFNLYAAQGLPSGAGEQEVFLDLPTQSLMLQQSYGSKQFQPNATDAITWSHGKHLFKAGADYRQTTAYYGDGDLSRGPYAGFTYTTAASILSNLASGKTVNFLRTDPTTKNFGLFVQDQWRILPRLSLSLGLRWDLLPPPSVSGAPMYGYTGNVNDPSSLGVSQPNAPLYKTTYTDFAPRFGLAWTIHDQPGHELVLRAGSGLFYDSIALNSLFGNGNGIGTATTVTFTSSPFPSTASKILVPVALPPQPPYNFIYYPDNQIVPPSAIQWNVGLEQALGAKQSVTMGYVASLGQKLTHYQRHNLSKINPLFVDVYLYVNGPGSDYNSLQVKYQRQMSHGLQALASYTWAHSIDYASTDDQTNIATFPLQRGNSNFDIRHNLTAALVYNLPTHYNNRFETALLGSWNADLWFVARTAFPFEPVGPAVTDPLTGSVASGELNYNGKNPYVYKPGIPGGRQIDPTVFSVTTSAFGVGNAPRNFLRGFGENQANVALQRSFPLYERAQLEFRAEAFNLVNHPNFGTLSTTCGVSTRGGTCNSPIMGQATNTLSTGLGGLSSLYQQGGPRSLQFLLKLQF
jgi:hypothetical protein